jgi:uncharacterized membrane protein
MVGEPFRKTKMARVAYWLFIICFPFLLLTSTVRLEVNSRHIYEYGFDRYEISEVTGIDRSQLSQVVTRLIDYFNSRVETPQIKVVKDGKEIELFHDYELIHLQDVKRLFQLDYLVQGIVLAYIVIYVLLPSLVVILRKPLGFAQCKLRNRRISLRTGFLLWKRGHWQDLAKGITRGCIFTLGLIAVFGIASIFSFEWLFIQFHRISFSNPYWMLDPSKDYLIMLFPQGFWQDLAIIGGGAIAGEALLLGGIAWAVPFIHQRHMLRDKLSSEKDS